MAGRGDSEPVWSRLNPSQLLCIKPTMRAARHIRHTGAPCGRSCVTTVWARHSTQPSTSLPTSGPSTSPPQHCSPTPAAISQNYSTFLNKKKLSGASDPPGVGAAIPNLGEPAQIAPKSMGLGQLFNIIAGPISFNSGGPVRHSKKKIQPINPQPRGGGQHKGNGAVSAQPRQAAVQQQRHVLPAVPGQGGAVRGGRRDGQGVADAEEAELQPGGGKGGTGMPGGQGGGLGWARGGGRRRAYQPRGGGGGSEMERFGVAGISLGPSPLPWLFQGENRENGNCNKKRKPCRNQCITQRYGPCHPNCWASLFWITFSQF